jgi:bifunctional DNA-binding transcriptional regulator/antitoxin component of YhaV-PrlF toxin-antitoxin module
VTPVDVDRLADSDLSVADRIRALNAAGMPRADIARRLGKRYQHVRNVLEADRAKASAAQPGVRDETIPFDRTGAPQRLRVADVEARGGGVYRLTLRADGSVVVPKEVRDALGVGAAPVLMAKLEGEEFKLISADTALRRIQDLLRPSFVEGVSWVDELLAERRREVARENADG